MGLYRSALYLPASNDRAIAKAPGLASDVVILDLEDAVSIADKKAARTAACDAICSPEFADCFTVLRINGLETEWGSEDLAAAMKANPDAILVPKVSDADATSGLSKRIENSKDCSSQLWVMIETPLAFLNVQSIAETAKTGRLSAFVIGTNDLAKDLGLNLKRDRTGVLHALSQSVLAAKAYGVTVLDGVYNDFKDLDGFRAECIHGRMLGMDGKSVIHPTQIEVCNEVFGPSQDELAWAELVVSTFALPENVNTNVLSINGQMVERLHADMAANLLEQAKEAKLI